MHTLYVLHNDNIVHTQTFDNELEAYKFEAVMINKGYDVAWLSI